MKKLFITILTATILTACGSAKKTTTQSQTPESTAVETAEPVATPETPITAEELPETPKTPEPVIEQKVEKEKEIIIESTEEKTVVETVEVEEVAPVVLAFNHNSFDSILKNNVSAQGNVNYAAIKSNWSSLRAYIASLGENMPTDSWSKEEKLSYWMNAYNAMTIDLILRNYPTSSIKDIKKPWDQRLWKLGKKWYNLDEIEHQILRKMGDARIHFGINCASFSCPPLLNEAFTADKVDNQLDQVARAFVNDTKRNTITANRIEISKIFTWFKKDFTQDGSVIDFLNKYSNTQINSNASVRSMDYDWNLNK